MYKVIVMCYREFPIDMLRVDEACPVSQEDSDAIWMSVKNFDSSNPYKFQWLKPYTVNVRMPSWPTISKWEAYGCELRVQEM